MTRTRRESGSIRKVRQAMARTKIHIMEPQTQVEQVISSHRLCALVHLERVVCGWLPHSLSTLFEAPAI